MRKKYIGWGCRVTIWGWKIIYKRKKGEREIFFGARRKGYIVINRNVVTGTPVSEPRVYTDRGTNLV